MPAGVCKRMHVAARAFSGLADLGSTPLGWLAFIVAVGTVYRGGRPGCAGSPDGARARGPVRVRRADAVHRDHGRAHQARGENAGRYQGCIRGLGTADRDSAAARLRPAGALSGSALTQWRVRRIPLAPARVHGHRPSACPTGSPRSAFHAIGHPWPAQGLVNLARYSHAAMAAWLLAVAAAAVLQWAVQPGPGAARDQGVDPAHADPGHDLRPGARPQRCRRVVVAVLVTLGVAISLVTIVFALPFVTLLQRSMRHAQLLNASRIDSKTGLLNAGTWEREAASEVARAVRTRSPLAAGPDRRGSFQAGQRPAWSSRRG